MLGLALSGLGPKARKASLQAICDVGVDKLLDTASKSPERLDKLRGIILSALEEGLIEAQEIGTEGASILLSSGDRGFVERFLPYIPGIQSQDREQRPQTLSEEVGVEEQKRRGRTR